MLGTVQGISWLVENLLASQERLWSRELVMKLSQVARWMDILQPAMWCGPRSTHREARKLILVPKPVAKTRPLSFNRTQSRVVIGLLTGYNTMRRHLYLMGLNNIPLCRGCGAEDETSGHTL